MSGRLPNSSTAVIQPSTLQHFTLVSLLELERLELELQSREEEEQQEEVDKENRPDEEQRKLTVVEELKEELQQFHRRRKVERRQQDGEESHLSRAFDAVQLEVERQEATSETRLQVSPTPGHRGAALPVCRRPTVSSRP